jgi:hypothetical protein
MASKSKVIESIQMMANVLVSPPANIDKAIDVYWGVLQDYTDGELARAVIRCIQESKFFPQPATLKANADAIRAEDHYSIDPLDNRCVVEYWRLNTALGAGQFDPDEWQKLYEACLLANRQAMAENVRARLEYYRHYIEQQPGHFALNMSADEVRKYFLEDDND